MIQNLRRILRMKSPLELASGELVEAERALLECETATEYAAALVEYNRKRITRLRRKVKELSGEVEA